MRSKLIIALVLLTSVAPCLWSQTAVQRHLFSGPTMMMSPVSDSKMPLAILPSIDFNCFTGTFIPLMAQAAVNMNLSGFSSYVPTIWGGDNWHFIYSWGQPNWQMRLGGLFQRGGWAGPKYQ